jgi:hypothetical protein
MKLKYKIAKTTELRSEDIIKRILLVIEKKNYGILEVSGTSVSFDNRTGGLVRNWEYARQMKSGTFEIVNNGNNNVVVFEYYPIPVFDFIWVGIMSAIPIGFGIVNDAYYVGFISWIFIGQLIFKHYNLKNKAEEMLREVVS